MKTWGALGVVLMLATGVAAADYVHNISVPYTASMDLMGDADNIVWTIDVATAVGLPAGTPLVINGIGWNIWIATNGNSTLSESMWYMDDNVALGDPALYVRPGAGQGAPGTMQFNTGGVFDLTDNGIADLPLTTGVLRLEFFEDSKDDFPNAADAMWRDGTISIQVTPEPASLVLLAAALLLRRR